MKFTPDERGQGLVEYAFLFSLVVVVVIVALTLVGMSIGELYDGAVTALLEVFS